MEILSREEWIHESPTISAWFSPAPLGFMILRVPTSLNLCAGPSKLPKEWIKHPLCFFIEGLRHKPKGNPDTQTAVVSVQTGKEVKIICLKFPSHETPMLWLWRADSTTTLRASCLSLAQVVFWAPHCLPPSTQNLMSLKIPRVIRLWFKPLSPPRVPITLLLRWCAQGIGPRALEPPKYSHQGFSNLNICLDRLGMLLNSNHESVAEEGLKIPHFQQASSAAAALQTTLWVTRSKSRSWPFFSPHKEPDSKYFWLCRL